MKEINKFRKNGIQKCKDILKIKNKRLDIFNLKDNLWKKESKPFKQNFILQRLN